MGLLSLALSRLPPQKAWAGWGAGTMMKVPMCPLCQGQSWFRPIVTESSLVEPLHSEKHSNLDGK